MGRKRKTLPHGFEDLLRAGDLAAMTKVYDTCELAAYDRPSSKHTALHLRDCPEGLVRWLVGEGLDVDTPSRSGDTPLQWRVLWGDAAVLLELGADVDARNHRGYAPLHNAVSRSPKSVRQLIDHGADMTIAYTSASSSFCDVAPPLQYALTRCGSADIRAVAASARIMLDAGCPVPPNAAEEVRRIGTALAFIREGRAGTGARGAETDRAMAALYEMFGVTPVEPRRMHHGTSPITVTAGDWRAQFQELWSLLVPAGGCAPTRQGEVIRAAGRISRELLDNGGLNWNGDYRAMRDHLIQDLASGTPVTTVDELTGLAHRINRDHFDDAIHRITELAVAWVLANPLPVRRDETPPDAEAPSATTRPSTSPTPPTVPNAPTTWLHRFGERRRRR